MIATVDTAAWLVGKSFDCAFDNFAPRLTVLSPTEMRVQATLGETNIDEVVKSAITDVRPGLVVVNWTEQNGNFVVQVQDHQNGVVHNYARMADGQVFCARGMLAPSAPV
ncbi:hypothetical protein J3P71_27950 (plasmid) [Rhizobium leguminosarum]|uniref:MoaF-related domain-containing protein n=1 Tax=Rhizobium leguminosarum TaxID=384 RepID=UPI00144214C8|nr:hypothetical protein [Rhizobium leguminosarum]MBY5835177.1 hypothetical protein [Rhizobium leguminosarum]MBY5870126.1 hypothetical protein [Rhizobium leguminosarum]NKM08890.1 hypothetical protein [Rhizobium leguminosarum bv. viciae]NKM76035.1 hypothetical protein [Rhizobium leguminosarum bv. viciae]QSZ11002.1 hypothetical protein J3P71_27950 [Rhizobium leguminosarum]